MKPTIGRIVHYTMPNYVAEEINRRRKDARDRMDWHRALKSGAQVHVGNEVHEGDVFPLMITKVWGNDEGSAFNGQLMLDGNDIFWVTSTKIGEKSGECRWPPRE
jgi:hypothetical protein